MSSKEMRNLNKKSSPLSSLFLVLILSLGLSSCGDKPETAETSFIFSMASFNANQTQGGLVIYGTNGVESFQIAKRNINDIPAIEIPLGEWRFTGVLWQGPGLMTGASKCASLRKSLVNSNESVDLVFNNSNCEKTVFNPPMNKSITGPVAGDGTVINSFSFKSRRLHSCAYITSSQGPSACYLSGIPDGMSKSFKIGYRSFNTINGTSFENFFSGCFNREDGKHFNIPIDLNMNGLIPLIQAFEDKNCVNEDRPSVPDYGYALTRSPEFNDPAYKKVDYVNQSFKITIADNIVGVGYNNPLIGHLPKNYSDCVDGTGGPTCLGLTDNNAYTLDDTSTSQITAATITTNFVNAGYNYINDIKPDGTIKDFGAIFERPKGAISLNDEKSAGQVKEIIKVYSGPVGAALSSMGISRCESIRGLIGRSESINLPFSEEVITVTIAEPLKNSILGQSVDPLSSPFRIEVEGTSPRNKFFQALEGNCSNRFGHFYSQQEELDNGVTKDQISEFYYKDLGQFADSRYELFLSEIKGNGERFVQSIKLNSTGSHKFRLWSAQSARFYSQTGSLTDYFRKTFADKYSSIGIGIGEKTFFGTDVFDASNSSITDVNSFGSATNQPCKYAPKFDLNSSGVEFTVQYTGCSSDANSNGGTNNDGLFIHRGDDALNLSGLNTLFN